MLGGLLDSVISINTKEAIQCLLGSKIERVQEMRSAPPVGAGSVIGRTVLEKRSPYVAQQAVAAHLFSAVMSSN